MSEHTFTFHWIKFRVQEQKKQSTLEWVAFLDADLAPTNFANL